MRTKKAQLPPVPEHLEEYALIDGPTLAATAGCSMSKLHDMVRRGDAPPPEIKLPGKVFARPQG